MKGLVHATRYLTIVPVGGDARACHPKSPGAGVAWFPVVGLLIGAVLVVVDRLAAWVFPSLLGALFTVTAWKVLTGGLHLDGLADCLDGLAGRDPAHRLAIMRDSRLGTFGGIGLILVLLLEAAALAELPAASRWRALLTAPAVARAIPALLARLYPSARAEGHGARFQAEARPRAVFAGLAAAIVVAVGLLGWVGIVGVTAAAIAGVGIARFMTTRLGGVTGDVFGAAIEMSELVLLLVVAAWAGVPR